MVSWTPCNTRGLKMTGDKHEFLELGSGKTLDSEQDTLQHKRGLHMTGDKHDILELGRG